MPIQPSSPTTEELHAVTTNHGRHTQPSTTTLGAKATIKMALVIIDITHNPKYYLIFHGHFYVVMNF